MALKLIEDFFEVGANPENISGAAWSLTSGRVAGSGCITQNGSGTWVAPPGQGWAAGISDMYSGFALKLGANANQISLFTVLSDTNTTPHLVLSMDATNRLVVYRGVPGGGGVLIATSPVPFPVLAQWRSVNVYFKIDGSSGRAVVKVDGATVIDFTGNTRNGGTSQLIDAVRVVVPNSTGSGFADLVISDNTGSINNTYPGDIAVIRRLPNANGTYNEFTGSDGNSADNYQLVDEAPSNDTDYTFASASGQKDSYNVEDLPAATISVLGVRAVAKTAKSGAGSAGMSVFIRENSTNTFSSSAPLSTSFSWQADIIREKAPSTDAPWTTADVNGMEIGVRSESA